MVILFFNLVRIDGIEAKLDFRSISDKDQIEGLTVAQDCLP